VSGIYRSAAGAQLLAKRYQEFLKLWPQPNRQMHVATRQGETFVIACGKDHAPAVVLLHGAGSNSAMWIAFARAWAPHLKLYAVDLIGEPGSSAGSRPSLKSAAYALWLDDVVQALHIDRFAMIGASFGGWVALDYATRYPERIDRLVLLVPGGVGRQRRSLLFKVLPLLLLGDWGRKRAMKIALGPGSTDAPAGPQPYTDYMLLVQRHFRSRMEPLPVFTDAALQQLRMPVLAVLGGKDAILNSAETRRRLALNVPHAELEYFADIGHGVFAEQTGILEFLAKPRLHQDSEAAPLHA
jgi:pimeloyl-ACP methyl ester carboxylesterase